MYRLAGLSNVWFVSNRPLTVSTGGVLSFELCVARRRYRICSRASHSRRMFWVLQIKRTTVRCCQLPNNSVWSPPMTKCSACTCTCIGLTWAFNIFRTPETASIADVEGANDHEMIPLRVCGPYRSEYGRLGEFPNLPPLLVRTGVPVTNSKTAF